MFGLIPFIESFFFLSLGITFILIFLMVFHFKQRIEKLERNNTDLSDLCNRIMKEVTNLHLQRGIQEQGIQLQKNNYVPPKEHICENIKISTSIPISFCNGKPEEIGEIGENGENGETYKKIIVMDDILDDEFDYEEGDEGDETDTDTDIDDEEYIEEDEDIEDIEDIEIEEIEEIEEKEEKEIEAEEIDDVRILSLSTNVVDDVTELIKLENENDNLDENEEKPSFAFVIPTTTTTTTTNTNYHSINVKTLKIMAISKGLCSDTTKMKRVDLIKLLTDADIEEQKN